MNSALTPSTPASVIDWLIAKTPERIRQPSKTEFFVVAVGGPLFAGFLPQDSIGDLFVLIVISLWAVSILHIRIKLGIWKSENIIFGTDKSPRTLLLYVAATAAGLIVLSGYGNIWSVRSDFEIWRYAVYTGVGTAMQEFLYRVYLLTLGAMLFPRWLNVSLNIVLFALMHWFFPNPHVVLSATILGGGLFTTVYFFRPNWVLIWFVHGIMTFAAINARIF